MSTVFYPCALMQPSPPAPQRIPSQTICFLTGNIETRIVCVRGDKVMAGSRFAHTNGYLRDVGGG